MNIPIFSGLEEVGKKKTRQWMFFPVSAVMHGLVIAAVVIVPLMEAGANLPPLKVNTVFMVAAPPVPPPPPAAPSKRSSTRASERRERDNNKPRPMASGRIVAPLDIPDEIVDENIDDFGFDEGSQFGVIGGVVGGVTGGVIGGVLDESSSPNLQETRLTQLQAPKLIRRVAPQYPDGAIKSRVQGMVIVEAVTDIYGRVVKTNVISGHALLRNAAVQAVKQWVYEPYILSGIPKPVVFTVTVTFSLTNN